MKCIHNDTVHAKGLLGESTVRLQQNEMLATVIIVMGCVLFCFSNRWWGTSYKVCIFTMCNFFDSICATVLRSFLFIVFRFFSKLLPQCTLTISKFCQVVPVKVCACVCVSVTSWSVLKRKKGRKGKQYIQMHKNPQIFFCSSHWFRCVYVCVCDLLPLGLSWDCCGFLGEGDESWLRHQTTSHPDQHLSPPGAFVSHSVTHGSDGLSKLSPHPLPPLPVWWCLSGLWCLYSFDLLPSSPANTQPTLECSLFAVWI